MAVDVTFSATASWLDQYFNWMLIVSTHPSWQADRIRYGCNRLSKDQHLRDCLISFNRLYAVPTLNYVVGGEPIRFETVTVVGWFSDAQLRALLESNLNRCWLMDACYDAYVRHSMRVGISFVAMSTHYMTDAALVFAAEIMEQQADLNCY